MLFSCIIVHYLVLHCVMLCYLMLSYICLCYFALYCISIDRSDCTSASNYTHDGSGGGDDD